MIPIVLVTGFLGSGRSTFFRPLQGPDNHLNPGDDLLQ